MGKIKKEERKMKIEGRKVDKGRLGRKTRGGRKKGKSKKMEEMEKLEGEGELRIVNY